MAASPKPCESSLEPRIPNPESRIPRLIPIVDADVAARVGWTIVDLAKACLAGGATLLQLRAKRLASGEFLDVASRVVEEAHRAGARVIVNDRADVARLSGADGVHVGQEDLSPAAVRALMGPAALIGVSTHTVEQIDAVLNPLNLLNLLNPLNLYLAIGPVFATTTKDTGYTARGLEMVRAGAARTAAAGVPLVGIGGITLDTAPDVIRAGAASVAVINDLVSAGDPAARVRAYLQRLTV